MVNLGPAHLKKIKTPFPHGQKTHWALQYLKYLDSSIGVGMF
jgi:hypothetical protein